MATPAQKRAVRNYRANLAERGLSRFEVVGRNVDRELVRAFAKQLAENGPQAAMVREAMSASVEKYAPKKGGIWETLRNSPLVGSGVKFKRYRGAGRKVDL